MISIRTSKYVDELLFKRISLFFGFLPNIYFRKGCLISKCHQKFTGAIVCLNRHFKALQVFRFPIHTISPIRNCHQPRRGILA